jgi:hypothetical protein
MKAFVAAVIAMGVIAVGAHFYLDGLGFSSANTFASPDVRLGG